VEFRLPNIRSFRLAAPILGVAFLLSVLTACGKKEDVSPEQARHDKGRTLYALRCASCHHPADPRKDGALGPAIAGSGLELLDAKLNRGGYPEGYTPKRETRLMQRLPTTPEELEALHAFLNAL
jgi:mono/diheme cytochrome c family protein